MPLDGVKDISRFDRCTKRVILSVILLKESEHLSGGRVRVPGDYRVHLLRWYIAGAMCAINNANGAQFDGQQQVHCIEHDPEGVSLADDIKTGVFAFSNCQVTVHESIRHTNTADSKNRARWAIILVTDVLIFLLP